MFIAHVGSLYHYCIIIVSLHGIHIQCLVLDIRILTCYCQSYIAMYVYATYVCVLSLFMKTQVYEKIKLLTFHDTLHWWPDVPTGSHVSVTPVTCCMARESTQCCILSYMCTYVACTCICSTTKCKIIIRKLLI